MDYQGDYLKKSILQTVIWFDLFNYPLTAQEIWTWLYRPSENENSISLENVVEELEQIEQLGKRDGFYFLLNKDHVTKRLQRYVLAERKYRRAKWAIKLLRYIPTIKMIGICNTLAISNSRDGSDIDLFLVCRRGTLFISRLLVTGLMDILRARPTAKKERDQLCLSFFVTDNALNLKNVAISQNDIYLAYWIVQVVPVYDPDKAYARFRQENSWIKRILPHSFKVSPSDRRQVAAPRLRNLLNIFPWIWLENIAKRIQLKILPSSLRSLMNQDSRVVINDSMLKFHQDDRREMYNKKFAENIKTVNHAAY